MGTKGIGRVCSPDSPKPKQNPGKQILGLSFVMMGEELGHKGLMLLWF